MAYLNVENNVSPHGEAAKISLETELVHQESLIKARYKADQASTEQQCFYVPLRFQEFLNQYFWHQ